jgi:hypothetical protein
VDGNWLGIYTLMVSRWWRIWLYRPSSSVQCIAITCVVQVSAHEGAKAAKTLVTIVVELEAAAAVRVKKPSVVQRVKGRPSSPASSRAPLAARLQQPGSSHRAPAAGPAAAGRLDSSLEQLAGCPECTAISECTECYVLRRQQDQSAKRSFSSPSRTAR